MLLEALEILQSAGDDDNVFVTDFGLYKVVYILTVYAPLVIATFLMSQEYLGKKIACFPPDGVTDAQSGPLSEYCWNNGMWLSDGVTEEKNLYTQPHRFYAFYLPIQAVICMTPIIFWNVLTKARLLALLRGTEEFLENVYSLMQDGQKDEDPITASELKTKVKGQLRQFHSICLSVARDSGLSYVLIVRQTAELTLYCTFLVMQYLVYNQETKSFTCTVPGLTAEQVMCTVPVLDLLDLIWSINTASLVIAITLMLSAIFNELRTHFGSFQPMFFHDLPYGDEDDFNEAVVWDSRFTKHSYELVTLIMEENNAIMTKAYVLNAMKVSDKKAL